MPFLENLVEGLANAAGDTHSAEQIAKAKSDRKATADEELHANAQSILNDVRGLQDQRVKLDPVADKDKIAKIDAQLGQMRTTYSDLYHPEKNPGNLSKLMGHLKAHLQGNPYVPPEPVATPGEARERLNKTIAGYDAAGAGTAQPGGAETPKPLSGSKPYKSADGRWYQTMIQGGKIIAQPMPEGYEPPPEKEKPKKGLKYDASTDEVVDQDANKRYPRSAKNLPPEVADMFQGAKTTIDDKQKRAVALADARGASYGLNRPISVLDGANGNAPTEVTMGDIKKSPGRFIPSGPGATALAQENLMQDIAGTSQQARKAITDLKEDFPEDMRVKLAVAMRENDPHAALGRLISSGALGTLSDDQQDFVIAVNQLTENAMAMRSVLKTGAGSEDVRAAIQDTLPGILSPDKSFALRQLDAFDKTLARLHRGVPRVALPESSTPGEMKEKVAAAAGGTKSFSVNGSIYDIPADKVSAFKKKYPDAKEQ